MKQSLVTVLALHIKPDTCSTLEPTSRSATNLTWYDGEHPTAPMLIRIELCLSDHNARRCDRGYNGLCLRASSGWRRGLCLLSGSGHERQCRRIFPLKDPFFMAPLVAGVYRGTLVVLRDRETSIALRSCCRAIDIFFSLDTRDGDLG